MGGTSLGFMYPGRTYQVLFPTPPPPPPPPPPPWMPFGGGMIEVMEYSGGGVELIGGGLVELIDGGEVEVL